MSDTPADRPSPESPESQIESHPEREGISRRRFITGAAAAGAAGVLGVPSIASAATPSTFLRVNGPDPETDLIFVNGKIHTMNDKGTIARTATVRDGRFVAVGRGARARGPRSSVINLRGRTVVPGIIDNHNHIVLM
ncbi:MAG TPA: twin-arginine translocation signal domain-containing protein, partial [Acidimicrobiia bacterium]